jgi:hypothetical protein
MPDVMPDGMLDERLWCRRSRGAIEGGFAERLDVRNMVVLKALEMWDVLCEMMVLRTLCGGCNGGRKCKFGDGNV